MEECHRELARTGGEQRGLGVEGDLAPALVVDLLDDLRIGLARRDVGLGGERLGGGLEPFEGEALRSPERQVRGCEGGGQPGGQQARGARNREGLQHLATIDDGHEVSP